jgi:hypothetical protein
LPPLPGKWDIGNQRVSQRLLLLNWTCYAF